MKVYHGEKKTYMLQAVKKDYPWKNTATSGSARVREVYVWCVYACILYIDDVDLVWCSSPCCGWGGLSARGISWRICKELDEMADWDHLEVSVKVRYGRMSVTIYQSTRLNISKDLSPLQYFCKKPRISQRIIFSLIFLSAICRHTVKKAR
jgi:hypothetical protein